MKKPGSRTYDFADSVSAAMGSVVKRLTKDPFRRLTSEDQARIDAAEAKRQRKAEKRK